MINRQSFLGIPMAQRGVRRRFVVSYWAVVVLLLSVLAVWGKGQGAGSVYLSSFYLFVFGLTKYLGGVSRHGLVRMFMRSHQEKPDYSFMTPEDIAERKASEREALLDERDLELQNSAHFNAFDFVRKNAFWVMMLLLVLDSPRLAAWAFLRMPILWLLLIMIESLPQTMILWAEPDLAEA